MLIDDSGRTESRQAQSNTTQHSNQSTGIVMWLDIVKLILKQKGKNYWTKGYCPDYQWLSIAQSPEANKY